MTDYTVVATNEPNFEAQLRSWLSEWDSWCKQMDKKFTVYVPLSIQAQKENFKLWVSFQKNIIVLDMYK